MASSSSPDGPWTDQGQILSGAALFAPFIFAEGGTFYVFYASDSLGGGGDNYLATAANGAGAHPKSPNDVSPTTMLTKGAGGSWDANRVGEPSVLKVGSTYYMAYEGDD